MIFRFILIAVVFNASYF